ncbi:hypothetical protein CCYA_CCYA08G2392 [Cyanidiococcus yangmingshanensis]|uniref:[RNA-polymerase]-subunit kinase n=1 Tax=Cyanidiococcus yangmingshanensis TaxID=2690220 RepID=A0A7J7II48_9RHOD|nr:Cyclin-Dependent Kinase 7 [Cyanidiococcus yangmingshanensis]KAK4531535.1 hypothetical protein CCYA_CCYA08G2392 [Cyanidiococcus yangmingshanensis]
MIEPAERYEKKRVLGQGTYGVVYLATDRCTAQPVALKKVRLADYTAGVSMTAWRELRLLPELCGHANIISLLDVYSTKASELYLVYEYCETDLERLITERNLVLSQGDIKNCLRQLLEGVAACHENWVLHRDLKPSNLLITSDGVVKLADFGLARVYAEPDLGTEHGRRMTHQVVTRWYRAPELLFGATAYGPAVDMWSVGCIFAELMRRVPFLPGQNDLDQLGKIFATLGTPDPQQWPGVDALPAYMAFTPTQQPPLSELFRAAPPAALDLLARMLALNPNERISAKEALAHDYFHTGAAESDPRDLMARWRRCQAQRQTAKKEQPPR